ncbi:MAG: oxidoreductase, partial [Gemmatimonadetes bacterium]|nr:oxidoreductase [Gemmatimonadota bacterium]
MARLHQQLARPHRVAAGELVLVDPAGRQLPAWEPGAHLDLHLPGGVVRQYSLCGDTRDRNHYRVAVLREPAGRGGSTLVHTSLRPGELLDIRGPRNHFAI